MPIGRTAGKDAPKNAADLGDAVTTGTLAWLAGWLAGVDPQSDHHPIPTVARPRPAAPDNAAIPVGALAELDTETMTSTIPQRSVCPRSAESADGRSAG